MRPDTHLAIDRRLVGEPVEIGEGTAAATLVTLPVMTGTLTAFTLDRHVLDREG